jgi:hypothetical protein
VVSETTANAIVAVQAGEQRIQLPGRSFAAITPQFEQRVDFLIFGLRERRCQAALCYGGELVASGVGVVLDAANLIDGGDRAACELGNLGVDVVLFGFDDMACRFGQVSVDVEAATVNLGVELPDQLFCI